jgi:hypothetical protein
MRSVFVYQLQITNANQIKSDFLINPRANGTERRSGRKPGARVLIPPGYLHNRFATSKWVHNQYSKFKF